MGEEKKVLSVRGLVRENPHDKYDQQFVETEDERIVYPAYLLQWFVGKRVDITIRVVEEGADEASVA